MSDRVWFYADGGKQLGPCSEAQLGELIASGAVTGQTFVWTDGMENWRHAQDVPGLMPSRLRPPGPPNPGGGNVAGAGFGGDVAPSGTSGRSLWVDFGIWDFTWRSIVLMLCSLLVIPLPWVLVWYLKWLVPHIQVRGRPNLGFEGTAMTIVPWFFGAIVLTIALTLSGSELLGNLSILVQLALDWLFLKWVIENLSANGQPLGLGFTGSIWGYLGWALLTAISVVTVIGWAWVGTAWMRWCCGHIQGTRRAVIFNGSGLEFLWRTIVFAIAASFIIPIPWMCRWMMRWAASQTELVER